MKNLSNIFKLNNEGDVDYYLSMNVSKYPNGTIAMSQLEMINKILNSLGIFDESKMHDTPENVILKNMKMETEGNKNGTIVQ